MVKMLSFCEIVRFVLDWSVVLIVTAMLRHFKFVVAMCCTHAISNAVAFNGVRIVTTLYHSCEHNDAASVWSNALVAQLRSFDRQLPDICSHTIFRFYVSQNRDDDECRDNSGQDGNRVMLEECFGPVVVVIAFFVLFVWHSNRVAGGLSVNSRLSEDAVVWAVRPWVLVGTALALACCRRIDRWRCRGSWCDRWSRRGYRRGGLRRRWLGGGDLLGNGLRRNNSWGWCSGSWWRCRSGRRRCRRWLNWRWRGGSGNEPHAGDRRPAERPRASCPLRRTRLRSHSSVILCGVHYDRRRCSRHYKGCGRGCLDRWGGCSGSQSRGGLCESSVGGGLTFLGGAFVALLLCLLVSSIGFQAFVFPASTCFLIAFGCGLWVAAFLFWGALLPLAGRPRVQIALVLLSAGYVRIHRRPATDWSGVRLCPSILSSGPALSPRWLRRWPLP